MKPITKEQRKAIKRIYDRIPLYEGDISAVELATAAGWRYVHYDDFPRGAVRDRLIEQGFTYVWVHGKYSAVYADADGIVKDYALAKIVTYREFRKTVQEGFDCLMVKWAGMWLGIERDGYVHS